MSKRLEKKTRYLGPVKYRRQDFKNISEYIKDLFQMPAFGKKAIFHSDGNITSDGTTVLGADDLSGVTAIYEAMRYLKQHDVEHRDVELLFTTGEELYCKGAKAFDYK